MAVMDYIGSQFPDCWAFVSRYFEEHVGVRVDPVAHQNKDLFMPVDEPQDGDLALIRTRGKWGHAGIFYYRGVLHHTHSQGVIYQRNVDAKFYRCRVQRPTSPYPE